MSKKEWWFSWQSTIQHKKHSIVTLDVNIPAMPLSLEHQGQPSNGTMAVVGNLVCPL
jgi:hypothetical protein